MAADTRSPAPLPPVLQEAISKFSAWAEQHLLAEQHANTIATPLYHYTNGYGLKGILESGRIWFTDYRHLNDPSELTHGIDMAHDVARLLGTGADGRVRLFLENIKDLFRHDNFATTLEFFIASFSRARDDLGQWRAYADNGRGFAIGFSAGMFRIGDPVPDRLPEFVGPVRYKLDEVCGRHAAALEEAVVVFLDAVNANADLVSDRAIGIPFMDQFAREIVAQPLIWNCLTSKHPAYEHEQEVRLLLMGIPERLAPHVTTRSGGARLSRILPTRCLCASQITLRRLLWVPQRHLIHSAPFAPCSPRWDLIRTLWWAGQIFLTARYDARDDVTVFCGVPFCRRVSTFELWTMKANIGRHVQQLQPLFFIQGHGEATHSVDRDGSLFAYLHMDAGERPLFESLVFLAEALKSTTRSRSTTPKSTTLANGAMNNI